MLDLNKSTRNQLGASCPFAFDMPLSFFEKADAEAGKQRRIGGVMSSESRDRQGEIILQRGLEFSDFIQNGWFNDNHTKDTDGILGYPESVQSYERGQVLPDGRTADTNCTWVEGYMLTEYPRADRIWQLGQALQSTGRRLGFSVEGAITQRRGPGDSIIAKAKVRNCAITNCPVNTDARLEILARSLQAIEDAGAASDEVVRAMTVGAAVSGGPVTGQGAGAVLSREDLERELRATGVQKARRRRVQKSLTDAQAAAWARREVPGLDAQAARDFVRMTHTLHRCGIL